MRFGGGELRHAERCRRDLRAGSRRAVRIRDELPGATLNGKPLKLDGERSLADGMLGIGANLRVAPEAITGFLNGLLHQGGMFIRNGSGP